MSSGGETETAPGAAGDAPGQSPDGRQGQHRVASPNPTPAGKTPANAGAKQVETNEVQPAGATTRAPMKSSAPKKSKARRSKPRSQQ